MKPSRSSKLRLAKETVRLLSDAQLKNAQGAMVAFTNNTCGVATCGCSGLPCSQGCLNDVPVSQGYTCNCPPKQFGTP